MLPKINERTENLLQLIYLWQDKWLWRVEWWRWINW